MKQLSETQINLHSPYKVSKDNANTLTFLTEQGVLYHIGFAEDTILDIPNVYQMYIENVCNIKSTIDDNVRRTIICILEQFFELDNYVLLYICDIRDGQQKARERLFSHWFNTYSDKQNYILHTASKIVDNTYYCASIVIKKDNPYVHQIITNFNNLIVELDSK